MKLRLLCDSCEGRLSEWEKVAAERLFVPYHNDTAITVRYESWLAKFCASLVWRVLFVHSKIGPLGNLSATQNEKVGQALNIWKHLMFGSAENPGAFELHILPMDILASVSGLELPPNMNHYLLRAVDMDVAGKPGSAFVYAKLCRLIVLGFVERPQFRQWHGSRVAITQGVIRPRQFVVPVAFARYLAGKARAMAELQAKLSERQKAKIETAMLRDPARAARSETLAAIAYDVAMFGKLPIETD